MSLIINVYVSVFPPLISCPCLSLCLLSLSLQSGSYLTLHIAGVSRTVAEYFQLKSTPLVVHGLLPHENKVISILLRTIPSILQCILGILCVYCGIFQYTIRITIGIFQCNIRILPVYFWEYFSNYMSVKQTRIFPPD